jgi:peptide/nickel transport system permease protein
MAAGRPSPLRQLLWSRAALAAALVLAGLVLAAVAAPLIAPQNPYDLATLELMDSHRPPHWTPGAAASGQINQEMIYLLGTDDQGRDVLSAILFGLRVSLFVGLCVVAISSVLGTVLGVLAGYLGGKVDALIMRLADIWLSFPSILIALFIMSIWGRGVGKLIFAIVVVRWVAYARTSRGCTLAEKERDYVAAARALGQRPGLIMFRHILPNVLSPLGVIAAVEIALVIMLEATLSFLGVGTPITRPSLGMLIKNGYDDLLSGNWWITLFPGLTLILVVFSINILVDWLRDMLDPHLAATVGATQLSE